MIEVLNFVFQSFWTWSGTVIILCVLITPAVTLFSSGEDNRE